MRRNISWVVFLLLLSVVQTSQAAPPLTWVPARLVLQIQPGQSLVTSVKVISGTNLDDVSVLPNAALSPFVSPVENQVTGVRAGDAVDVVLTVHVPFQVASAEIDGTVQIRASRQLSGIYAKPLPVTLQVLTAPAGQVFVGNQTVSLAPPTGWYVVNDAAANVTAIYSPETAQLIDAGAQDTPPDIAISVAQNTARLSATEFADTFREGKFAKYSTVRTEEIAGETGLVVDDEASPVPFEPIRAALVPVGESMVIVTAYNADATEFSAVLSSLRQ